MTGAVRVTRRGASLIRLAGEECGRRNVVCFPPAGAGTGFFTGWKAFAADGITLWAVRLPGREGRFGEPPHADLAAAADEVSAAVSMLPPAETVFYGYCLGACLAYETARRLADRGERIELLAVAGMDAPRPMPGHEERVASMSDEDIVVRLTRTGILPPGTTTAGPLARLLIPALRADLDLSERYLDGVTARPPLPVRIAGVVEAGPVTAGEEPLGSWHALTSAGFELLRLPAADDPDGAFALPRALAAYPER